ncbi:MAG: hypothetical protein ACXU9O_14180 [Gemmatimonadaceae bacterium]
MSIAAAFIIATGAFVDLLEAAFFALLEAAFFVLTGDRFFLLAVFGLGFLAPLRLLPEGLLARFFEALLRVFFLFVAIFTCSLCGRRA